MIRLKCKENLVEFMAKSIKIQRLLNLQLHAQLIFMESVTPL